MIKKLILLIAIIIISILLYFFLVNEGECIDYGTEPQITSAECEELGGEVLDTVDLVGCCSEENFLGTISDLRCPCICCLEDVD